MRRKAACSFLDEVGNLALETQQMLLRAIQERRYRPVGDKADRNFNVRIIAATNEDLEVSVNEKRFRQDLLYRLHDFGDNPDYLRCVTAKEDIMPLAVSSSVIWQQGALEYKRERVLILSYEDKQKYFTWK